MLIICILIFGYLDGIDMIGICNLGFYFLIFVFIDLYIVCIWFNMYMYISFCGKGCG